MLMEYQAPWAPEGVVPFVDEFRLRRGEGKARLVGWGVDRSGEVEAEATARVWENPWDCPQDPFSCFKTALPSSILWSLIGIKSQESSSKTELK